MPIALYRIDDRLVHGQVVVGWGQPLKVGFIVLVDDEVAGADWEQELYRMGTPPNVELFFTGVAGVGPLVERLASDARPGILLTGTVETMLAVVRAAPARVRAVNIGGIHHREDRVQKLRYVFLNVGEERGLRALEEAGIVVTAQDVPSARPVPLAELVHGDSA